MICKPRTFSLLSFVLIGSLFPAPEKEKPAKIEGGGGILKKSKVRDLLANLASLSDPKTKK
jgi:hypothetical protein